MNARDPNLHGGFAEKARRLGDLFRTSDVAHGTVDFARFGDRKPTKAELKKVTRFPNGPATEDDWHRHLAGEMGLGVAPISSDNTCSWGCIDHDDYGVSHGDLVASVKRHRLPLVVCRSKSDGAHLFLFLAEPAPAAEVRAALRRACETLKIPPKEIFPKQEKLEAGGKASWLNMPYFGGEETDRFGVREGGLGMTLGDFLDAAEAARQQPADLSGLASTVRPGKERGQTAPDSRDIAARLEGWCRRMVEASPGDANNVLGSIAFDAGRYVGQTALTEVRARDAIHPVWMERKRGSEDTSPAAAEAEFEDVWRRQFRVGQQKGRPVEKGEADAPVTTCLADVVPRPIEWLWPDRIAIGKLSMIAGDPGLGKSLLSTWIAANVTRGGAWPFDEGNAPQGDVILLSAEDDVTDTVRPRFDAAGGDPRRAIALDAIRHGDRLRGFDLGRDVAMLGDVLAQRPGVRLVVIDPISAYLGSVDSHRNTDVRGVLMPLQKLAEEHRVAVLLVSHLRKARGDAINAVQGSGAFVAAVRSSLMVTRETQEGEDDDSRLEAKDTGRRIVTVGKNNLGPDGADRALAYRIVVRDNGDGISSTTVVWDSRLKMTANEALNPVSRAEKAGRPRDEAKAFLRRMLRDGPMSASELKRLSEENNVGSWRTIQTAKDQLGVLTKKQGRHWVWMLPGAQEELPI